MDHFIYLDNAATTPIAPEVKEAMLPYLIDFYGNPSSLYRFGQKCKEAVENARTVIAQAIGAKEKEIYFTSGGSESDNWVLRWATEHSKVSPCHIITSQIEHHAILNTCKYLETMGVEVTYLSVDKDGFVNLEELASAIRKNTVLISIMFANNEIGTIEPVKEIGRLAKEHHIYFHTDAVQAFGHVPIDVDYYNIDFLSASAHKFNGPKGVGFLYAREGVKLQPFIYGGGQEGGMRAGTENVAGIVGLATAAKRAISTLNERSRIELRFRNYIISRILGEIPYVVLNGHSQRRLSNNINFCFRFVEGQVILSMLDELGICVSTAAACSAGSNERSHVLMAIGVSEEMAFGSLRLTLASNHTMEEINYVISQIKRIVSELRKKVPEYEEFLRKL